jgi:peptidoglycan/LPS O-acetylase OafA/YrhL
LDFLTRRSARIDFLRGIAIFAVLVLHYSLTYRLSDSPLARLLPARLLAAAVSNGNYGVTVFFVISGFLITTNNLHRYQSLDRVRLSQFYAFRFARIIPPLILALAIIVTLGLLDVPSFNNSDGGQQLPNSFFVVAILSVLTFWHNLLMQYVGYFNYCLNIYWSLSVEEVFYLTFPLACVLLKRDRAIIMLCVAFIVAGPIYRSLHSDDELYYEYGYLACFDAIAFGCVTALLYRRIQTQIRLGRVIRMAAAVVMVITYGLGIDGHEVLGFSLIALSAAVLLTNAFDGTWSKAKFLPVRVVCWLGRHSYELYLFHIIVLAAMRDVLPRGALPYRYKLPWFLLFLTLSALLAAVVSRLIAEPLNSRVRNLLAGGAARRASP